LQHNEGHLATKTQEAKGQTVQNNINTPDTSVALLYRVVSLVRVCGILQTNSGVLG